MGNSRMYQALAAYGDRLSQVGLFSFKVSRTGIITESGVAISNMLTYINRWPHIKWLLTIHSCTGYKYTAWCCSTHIRDKDKCHMLFVKDDDLKQAFVTMMNKLVYAHRIILKPYVDALKNTSSDDSLRRIQEIQTLLAQNTEKRETLTKLMTQGIIDPILFNKETNELLSQADSFRDEINTLKNAVSGDVTKVTAATALLHFTEKGGILQEFDDDLFNKYVNRIIVRSRNEVRFELKCGLTLRERI